MRLWKPQRSLGAGVRAQRGGGRNSLTADTWTPGLAGPESAGQPPTRGRGWGGGLFQCLGEGWKESGRAAPSPVPRGTWPQTQAAPLSGHRAEVHNGPGDRSRGVQPGGLGQRVLHLHRRAAAHGPQVGGLAGEGGAGRTPRAPGDRRALGGSLHRPLTLRKPPRLHRSPTADRSQVDARQQRADPGNPTALSALHAGLKCDCAAQAPHRPAHALPAGPLTHKVGPESVGEPNAPRVPGGPPRRAPPPLAGRQVWGWCPWPGQPEPSCP